MRIVLLPDDYLPDGTRVHAKMLHELALALLKKGHEPIVITPGQACQPRRLLVENIEGVEVWRFRSGPTRGVGLLRRAINEWLLSYKAWLAIRGRVKDKKIDLCINYSPTIFFGPLVKKIKKKYGCYVYLVLRDFFPDWIIDAGLIKNNSLAAYFFRYYEGINYSSADRIAVQSEENSKVFNKKFLKYQNVCVLRNWADTTAAPPSSYDWEFFEEKGLLNKTIFFYGGNTGRAQNMENIMSLARSLLDEPRAHFLIIGQGDEFDLIQTLQADWNLKNTTILPSVSQSQFKRILPLIDVGLFSLARHHSAHNFPGKLLGYMVESKPILGSVNPGNDLRTTLTLADAGFVHINGDAAALTESAKLLTRDVDLCKAMGQNARCLLEAQFSVESAAESILSSVKR